MTARQDTLDFTQTADGQSLGASPCSPPPNQPWASERKPLCHHLAYHVARKDAMQEQALALWQHADPLTARRALASALDRLLRDLGWVRIRTNQGRKWMRECRALPMLLMGFDPADETLAVSEGYIHASGRRKREAAMKMTPEARHARAKKAAAASAVARKQRQNEKQA